LPVNRNKSFDIRIVMVLCIFHLTTAGVGRRQKTGSKSRTDYDRLSADEDGEQCTDRQTEATVSSRQFI